MEQDIARPPDPDVAAAPKAEPPPADADDNHDDKRDARLTRRVHVVLGLVIAVLEPSWSSAARTTSRARVTCPSC